MKTAQQVIQIARKHVIDDRSGREWSPCPSSAEVCLGDAIACYDGGDYEHARQRALKSIAYSVGVFHSDYKKAV